MRECPFSRYRVLAGVIMVISAGCQAPGVELQLKEEVSPERVGLRMDPYNAFAEENFLREGDPGPRMNYFGNAYEKHGYFDFRVFSIANQSSAPIEIFLTLDTTSGGPGLKLHQRFWSPDARNSGRVLNPTPADHVTVYRSEYEIYDPVLVFSSGGREVIEADFGDGSTLSQRRAILLRPGESAELSAKARLLAGFPLLHNHSSRPGIIPLYSGFFPPDRDPPGYGKGTGPSDGPLFERVLSTRLTSALTVGLVVRNQKDGSLRPVYMGEALQPRTPKIIGSPLVGYPGSDLSDSAYEFQFPGLPVLH